MNTPPNQVRDTDRRASLPGSAGSAGAAVPRPAPTVEAMPGGGLAAVARLLAAIAPRRTAPLDPQRFWALRHLIGREAPLPRAGSDVAQARRALAAAAEALEPSRRYRCLRTLAILHWEWAMAEERAAKLTAEARRCHAFAGLLFRRLLADEAFWDHFAADHQLAAEHLAGVRARIVGEILAEHFDRIRSYLLAADGDASRFHATCLTNWEQPPPRLGGAPAAAPASGLAEECAARAARIVGDWVSDILRRAHERLGESLETLPAGISRNFPAAIAAVAPAVEALPGNRRLLAFFVNRANELAYELAVADRFAEARQTIRSAVPHARRLAADHLRPGDGRHPDNASVCFTFLLACQLAEDPAESLGYLDERRRWGGQAEGERHSSHEARYHFQLGKLAFSGGSYVEAERQLKRAVQLDPDEPLYREQWAILCLACARSLAQRAAARLQNLARSPASFLAEARRGGENLLRLPRQWHGQAGERLQQARDLASAALRPQVEAEVSRLPSPLDWYWTTLRTMAVGAIQERRTQQYADLAAALEVLPAPPGDSRLEEARPLRAVLYFHLQELAWDAKDVDAALDYARRAAACDPSHPVLRETLEQLESYCAAGNSLRPLGSQPGAIGP